MSGLLSRLCAVLLFTSLAGCSALINPDADRLGTDPGTDSGVRLMDSGTMMGVDAGPGGFDAGDGSCMEGSRRCAGDTLVTCAGGMQVPQDCQSMDAFCQGDRCVPHVCRPNSRECSADGNGIASCSSRGHEVNTMACGDGRCDASTVMCVGGGDACDALPRVRPGSDRTLQLCSQRDQSTFQPAPNCSSMTRAESGDQIYELTLARETRLTFELTDVDEGRAVDTILYVRRACEEAESQVLCADDVPCGGSTAEPPACFDGVDVRQSRVTATLPAGTYYVVIDAFMYTTGGGIEFGCGEVRLRIDETDSDVTPGG